MLTDEQRQEWYELIGGEAYWEEYAARDRGEEPAKKDLLLIAVAAHLEASEQAIDKLQSLYGAAAAGKLVAERERDEARHDAEQLNVLLLVEAGELTERQGADRLGVDRMEFRRYRLDALGIIKNSGSNP